ncbi:TPA: hypothetical protein ACH3X1_004369 [Trebouxia sp. C0004]
MHHTLLCFALLSAECSMYPTQPCNATQTVCGCLHCGLVEECCVHDSKLQSPGKECKMLHETVTRSCGEFFIMVDHDVVKIRPGIPADLTKPNMVSAEIRSQTAARLGADLPLYASSLLKVARQGALEKALAFGKCPSSSVLYLTIVALQIC